MIKQRNIALCIVFSIITFGIYALYWFVCLTNDANQESGQTDATSGGTDFIAIFLSEKYGIDAWNYILIGNAVILIVAGALFGWDKALYSIIFQFTSTQIIHGWYKRYHKNTLLIITDSPEEVIRIIYEQSGHGATIINSIGSHNKQERTLVYSVVSSDEVKKLVSYLKEADEDIFINVIKTEQLNGNFYLKPND